MEHEDQPPNTPVPSMVPEPDKLPDTERPAARTSPTPVDASPDRTDEILAKLDRIERSAVDRDRRLADAILGLDRSVRDETNTKLDGVQHTARKALEASEECRKELKASHVWLSEWANQNAYEADRKWEQRITPIEGEIQALAKVVGEGFAASSRQIDKLARIVGSVLTHVAQSGGQRLDEGESSDTDESEAVTRSG